MRILNKRNLFFLSVLSTFGITSLTAQDQSTKDNQSINTGSPIIESTIASQQKAKVTIHQDNKIKQLLAIKNKMDKDGKFTDRYKIQLYYGNLEKANKTLKQAEEQFPQWKSTLQFETPNFKVWTGNYRSRLEADRALKVIHTKFTNAFIFRPEKK